jgi:hypothetical protein
MRSELVERATDVAESLHRIRPWNQPGDFTGSAIDRREVVVYTRGGSGLVIPGGPHDDPTIKEVRITGNVLAMIERGSLSKAADAITSAYPWITLSGARHIIEWGVLKK